MKKLRQKQKTFRSKTDRKPIKKIGKRSDTPIRNHRVVTHGTNGKGATAMEVAPEPVSIGEAMRRAVEELGDITIDDSLAASQLRQLAEAYEEVTRMKAAFNEKAEAAKVAKKALESTTELLLEKLRSFTHPAPLPLFDLPQAEADRQDMLDAADRGSLQLDE